MIFVQNALVKITKTMLKNVGKIVKVSTLGILGAGDLGKTWKCEACGCKF